MVGGEVVCVFRFGGGVQPMDGGFALESGARIAVQFGTAVNGVEEVREVGFDGGAG